MQTTSGRKSLSGVDREVESLSRGRHPNVSKRRCISIIRRGPGADEARRAESVLNAFEMAAG
jgi:hypothetical protein